MGIPHRIAFDEGSSLNHGWNPPAIVLSQTIAGVSPESPGWSTYHVLPQEAFLTSIKVVVPSIKGNITVDMKKTASAYSLGLISPPNTKAIVGIPKGSFTKLKSIKVNGRTIWNGAYRGGVRGITWNGGRGRLCQVQGGARHMGFCRHWNAALDDSPNHRRRLRRKI